MSGGGMIVAGFVTALALCLTAAQARDGQGPSRPPARPLGGLGIAQRHCGACHAVDAGPSPLADAPPFATLYRRYPPGGLDQILTEGMLAPRQWPEEGAPEHHPRMPMAQLDDDEVAQLKAYLRSLDRRPRSPARPR